jgi:hypothetical protein
MAKKPSVNLKQEKGRALKAENEAKKQAVQDKQRDAAEAVEWQQGTNARKASRDEAVASKADEAARRRQEKAALLAEEEANAGSSSLRKAPVNKKKGPKTDLALLEGALQSAADKKVKLKRLDLQRKQEQGMEKLTELVPAMDPLLANTEKMIGLMDDELVGRQANRAKMEEDIGASGIDAALASLSVAGAGGNAPSKSSKTLYNEFEERMLPVVKAEFPGLRLSQYKEKIWQLWKKSPENPANQVPPS